MHPSCSKRQFLGHGMLPLVILPLAGRVSAVTSRVALLGARTLDGGMGTFVEVGALGDSPCSLSASNARVKPRIMRGCVSFARARSGCDETNVHSTKGRLLISGPLHGRPGFRGTGRSLTGFVDMHSKRGRWREEKPNTKRYLTY